MTHGSLFSGIGGLTLQPNGWDGIMYFHCENGTSSDKRY
jgi:hypothetical protein